MKIPFPKDCPMLMERTVDGAIVLVGDQGVPKPGRFQVTVLSTGESYVSELKNEDYKPLPTGYVATLTN